jgi:monoamine oxidase
MSDQPDQSGLRLIWPHDPVPAVQRVVVAYGNSHALQEVFRGSRVRAVEQAESYLRQFRGFSDLKFLHALAVQWARIPFQRAAAYRLRPESNAALQQLRQGQAPVFFAADGLSSFNGWQEGALESAEAAVQQVSRYLQI